MVLQTREAYCAPGGVPLVEHGEKWNVSDGTREALKKNTSTSFFVRAVCIAPGLLEVCQPVYKEY